MDGWCKLAGGDSLGHRHAYCPDQRGFLEWLVGSFWWAKTGSVICSSTGGAQSSSTLHQFCCPLGYAMFIRDEMIHVICHLGIHIYTLAAKVQL